MTNKEFFLNWISRNWNSLVDRVSLAYYEEVKKHYFAEVGGEINLTELSKNNDIYEVETNAILLLVEKWLYAHASYLEKGKMSFYRNTFKRRTTLVNHYLYDDQEGLFYNYNSVLKSRDKTCSPLQQFYLYWLAFISDKELAQALLSKIDKDDPKLFVVFMGLRRLGLWDQADEIGKIIGFTVDDYNPRISTNTGPLLNRHSLFETLRMIKKAGLEAYDHSMIEFGEFYTEDNYLENARELREFADKIGLECNQTHAIFPVVHPSLSEEETQRRIMYTKRILEISKILGADHCIIHPINFYTEQENDDYFQQYLPLAKKLNIKIATENMFNWEDDYAALAACSNHENFKELCDLVNDSHFVACVDLGHAELQGLNTSAVQMIENLGRYVESLHIHDNNSRHDLHKLPLTSGIDFDLILDALARIDYRGDITFEANRFIDQMPKELHQSCLRTMYQLGLYFKAELLIRRKAKEFLI